MIRNTCFGCPAFDEGMAEYCETGGCSDAPESNADHFFRNATDEMLVEMICKSEWDWFCKNLDECNVAIEAGKNIPKAMCIKCIREWLKSGYHGDEE